MPITDHVNAESDGLAGLIRPVSMVGRDGHRNTTEWLARRLRERNGDERRDDDQTDQE